MDNISGTVVSHFEKYVHLSTSIFQEPLKFFFKSRVFSKPNIYTSQNKTSQR